MGNQEERKGGRKLRGGKAWGYLGVPEGSKRKRTDTGHRDTEKKKPRDPGRAYGPPHSRPYAAASSLPSSRFTWVAVQVPPLAVGMPLSLSTLANSRSDPAPVA